MKGVSNVPHHLQTSNKCGTFRIFRPLAWWYMLKHLRGQGGRAAGQPRLCNNSPACQDYITRPCLKRINKNKNTLILNIDVASNFIFKPGMLYNPNTAIPILGS